MAVQNKQTAKHRQAMIVVLFACNLLASLMQSLDYCGPIATAFHA